MHNTCVIGSLIPAHTPSAPMWSPSASLCSSYFGVVPYWVLSTDLLCTPAFRSRRTIPAAVPRPASRAHAQHSDAIAKRPPSTPRCHPAHHSLLFPPGLFFSAHTHQRSAGLPPCTLTRLQLSVHPHRVLAQHFATISVSLSEIYMSKWCLVVTGFRFICSLVLLVVSACIYADILRT